MQTVSLGFQGPDYGSGAMPASAPEEPKTKTCYPCMTIPGNLSLAKSLKAGQEFSAMVKFKVKEVTIRDRDGGDDKYNYPWGDGTHVELEAQEMMMKDGEVKEEYDEESGSDAFKKFLAKKGEKNASS